MKKLLIVGVLALLPLQVHAQTIFGFLDGNYYDENGGFKYLCFMDDSCIDKDGNAYTRADITSNPNPTPVFKYPSQPSYTGGTPLGTVDTPIPTPTPVIPTPTPAIPTPTPTSVPTPTPTPVTLNFSFIPTSALEVTSNQDITLKAIYYQIISDTYSTSEVKIALTSGGIIATSNTGVFSGLQVKPYRTVQVYGFSPTNNYGLRPGTFKIQVNKIEYLTDDGITRSWDTPLLSGELRVQ